MGFPILVRRHLYIKLGPWCRGEQAGWDWFPEGNHGFYLQPYPKPSFPPDLLPVFGSSLDHSQIDWMSQISWTFRLLLTFATIFTVQPFTLHYQYCLVPPRTPSGRWPRQGLVIGHYWPLTKDRRPRERRPLSGLGIGPTGHQWGGAPFNGAC